MVVSHFLRWIETARVNERAAAANALARAYVQDTLAFDDRCAAEAALTLLLDDPSAKVRLAMAEAMALSPHAPPQIVAALAADQPEVAAFILMRSPLLTEADLIGHVSRGHAAAQKLVASRPIVPMAVAAAIAEVGDAGACAALLANDCADIAPLSFRRMAERFGDIAELRSALVADARLPGDCRHALLVRLGEALRQAPLVVASMGRARAERVTREACIKGSVTLIDKTPAAEHDALIAHLRLAGELTAGFVLRLVAHGKVDFLRSVLAALSGQGQSRIGAMLAGGSDAALSALLRSSGLSELVHRPLIAALRAWREVANGKRLAGAQEISFLMLQATDSEKGGELATLLKSIHLDALRDNARDHARSIAAA